jgi:adenosine deaminase
MPRPLRSLLPLLAAGALVAPASAPAAIDAAERATARHLERIRTDPARRHDFLYAMPKGADLHHHLSGAVYAETMVRLGAQDGDCVDTTTMRSSEGPCGEGQRPIADALSDNELYDDILRAWSMKGFRDGLVSGHDHFFATFDLFDAALDPHEGVALAEVTSRAAAQNEQALETLRTPRFGDVWRIAQDVGWHDDLDELRRRLLDAGLAGVVPAARADTDAILAEQRRILRCGTPSADRACDLPVRFQVQVLRAMPKEVVFAQILLGFELMAADGRWVGLNLVQPEDAAIALADYRLHMRMIGFLRERYPDAHVTLHAGELVPGLAPPEDLRFHIREAIEVAGAERIGHGVAIRWERRPLQLLRRMARERILVEVPLTSNAQILGVSGPDHPLGLYRRHGVPVALATDDEGVSRTNLTEQYEQAVVDHGLGYRALKRIARDSLRHSFLAPGDKARALRAQRAAFERFERRFARAR